jgi:hypothetical protein
VAEGRIPKTQHYAFSGDEGTDVGMDGETAVSNDYKPESSKFTGQIAKVTIEVKPSPMNPQEKKAAEDAKAEAEIVQD